MAEDNVVKQFPDGETGVQSRFVIVHQLRTSADIQDRETKARTGWADTNDRATLMRRAADVIERLAAQAHEPSADVVEVRKVETVTGDFMQDEGEPFWRIEIGGYCADFDHEQAARNFAAAIAAMRPESERAGIVAWLRNPLTYVRGLSMAQSEHLADAIERGDDIKGNGNG